MIKMKIMIIVILVRQIELKSDLPDLSYNPHPKDNRNRFGEKPTKKEIENFMNFY